MIWQSQYLIVEDGQLYVYFGGTEGPHRQISDSRAPSVAVNYQETVMDHGAHFLPFNAALCRAQWRFDRLYALVSNAGGPTVGTALTPPQQLAGKHLFVNLVTRPAKRANEPGLDAGHLQVELLDESGRAVPGFTREACELLQGDQASLRVRWRGGSAAPSRACRAKFYLKRAFLYGFEFRSPAPE